MPTSFALTPHFEAFIRQQLAGGSDNNASEVVRDALRLLERQQREESLKLQALQRAAAEGVAAIAAGQFVDVDEANIESHVQALGSSVRV